MMIFHQIYRSKYGVYMELTENQRRAVEYVDGPLLIVAGPGSGKTRVLTQKGIYLIEKKNFELAIKHCDKARELGYDIAPEILKEIEENRNK